MQIKIELCWTGGDKFVFRMTTPKGEREYVRGEVWTRKLAKEALDLFQNVYGYNRKTIRFI